MDTQIIALKCPSCGNTNNVAEKEINYGYEFTCKQCLTTSVLVINKQLYTPKPGEHICIVCGRVAASDVRFCQCGAALVRKCDNLNCLKEIPADHSICDYCGWPQGISPTSDKRLDVIIKNAINDLHDKNFHVLKVAFEEIRRLGPKASTAIPLIFDLWKNTNDLKESLLFINSLGSLGELAIPILIKVLYSDQRRERKAALEVICHFGPKAFEAIPTLVDMLSSESDDEMLDNVQYSLEQIGESAIPVLRNLIEKKIPTDVRGRAINIIDRIENI